MLQTTYPDQMILVVRMGKLEYVINNWKVGREESSRIDWVSIVNKD